MYRKVKLLWIFCFLGFIHQTTSKVIAISENEKINYRLNDEVLPVHYTIELTPHFTDENGKEPFTFDGIVDMILFTERRNVNSITLHSRDLNISSIKIETDQFWTPWSPWNDSASRIVSTTYDEETHFLTINLDKDMLVNKLYSLSFKYVGILRTDMVGFYRSSYEEDGKTK